MFHASYLDSSFVGPHYPMFVEMRYPQLDITVFDDGEWLVYEMLNAPVVPSLTQWKPILKGLRNIEINSGTVGKLIHQIDPQYPEFWAREALKTKGILGERESRIQFEEDWAEKMAPKILRNPGLMERIARFGMRELDPARIALAIAKENPAVARAMGIRVDNEHVHTGKREKLC